MSESEQQKKEAPAPGSEYDAAATRLRDAAKWLLGAFAAVGAILATGLQLASLGSLGVGQGGRLALAVLGVLVAVGGIAWAIYAAGEVLSSRVLTLSGVLTDPDLAEELKALNASVDLLGDCGSVAELVDEHRQRFADLRRVRTEYDDATAALQDLDPNPPPPMREQAAVRSAAVMHSQAQARARLAVASERANAADRARLEALGAAGFLRLVRIYRQQRARMAIAAVVAALGITLFAWAANPPTPEEAVTSAVLPPTPSNVTIVLKNPSAAVRAALGKDCPVSKPIPGIAMTVAGQTYQVATERTKKCSAAWLTLIVPADGTVTAREAAK